MLQAAKPRVKEMDAEDEPGWGLEGCTFSRREEPKTQRSQALMETLTNYINEIKVRKEEEGWEQMRHHELKVKI